VLAFTRTKHRANRLQMFLEKAGIACERIHGNRSQPQRTEALAGFKAGRYRVLVATDIAARGIDIEALGLVVNFDVPHLPEDYIHRVGRTARAELTGDAYTFVSFEEEGDLRAIERRSAAPPARDLPRLRLQPAPCREAPDPDRRADRPDPRPRVDERAHNENRLQHGRPAPAPRPPRPVRRRRAIPTRAAARAPSAPAATCPTGPG
jgi:ATP-dependent RNA helicase RhlE